MSVTNIGFCHKASPHNTTHFFDTHRIENERQAPPNHKHIIIIIYNDKH